MPYTGGAQVIKPPSANQTWGFDMQKKEQDRMAKMAMKLAAASAAEGGDNPSGFEEGDLQFGDGSDVNPDDLGTGTYESDPEGALAEYEQSLSSEGFDDNTEMSAEDMPENFDSLGVESPQIDEEKARNLQLAKMLMGNEDQGQIGMDPNQIMQVEAAYDPTQQTGQFAGTGQAPQMDPMIAEKIRRAKMANSGAPQGGMPTGRFQMPQSPYGQRGGY